MSLDDVELFLVDSFDEAENMMKYLARNDEIAIDTETTGFKWAYGDYARTVQVGDEHKAWMIPIDRWWGLFLDLMKWKSRAKLNFMNAKFDYPFLRKAGIELDQSRIHDVGVMSHILEPHMSRALKNQASRWIDPRAGAAQEELSEALSTRSEWTWATIPIDFEPYWSYGALDSVLTQRLANHHAPLIASTGASYAYEIENAYQWVALAAETNGVPVDVPYAQDYHTKFLQYCTAVEKWCKTEYNISPGSNQRVIEKLQEAGYDFDKRTKGGALSLDGDVLEGIEHPLAQAVLKRRRLQKLASTYLQFYMGHATGAGRIHPTINTLGARTSRQSMNDPNFQNLPRASEDNPAANVVRNCVHARPGHVLIFCDFDQIEMRGLAVMSEDEGLRGAFRSDNDFFVNLAQTVFQDPTIVKKDPRRQITKNVGYAKIYGAGVAKLALTAGVPFEMAQHANSMFDAAYPKVKGFLGRLYNEAMALKEGPNDLAYTVCPLTGRRHYADPGKEYALANYRIQGWAASLFKIKMLELAAAGLLPYIILFVHDEVILEVPAEDARDVVYTLRKIMNDDQMFPVPISAGISWGERWGEKREWSDE